MTWNLTSIFSPSTAPSSNSFTWTTWKKIIPPLCSLTRFIQSYNRSKCYMNAFANTNWETLDIILIWFINPLVPGRRRIFFKLIIENTSLGTPCEMLSWEYHRISLMRIPVPVIIHFAAPSWPALWSGVDKCRWTLQKPIWRCGTDCGLLEKSTQVQVYVSVNIFYNQPKSGADILAIYPFWISPLSSSLLYY